MAGTYAIPFTVYNVTGVNGANPRGRRLPEKASLTLLTGTPVALSSGYLIERTAIDGVTKVIAGITQEFAHNLTSDGVAKTLTYGAVQNQSSAVLIPLGAPLSDGNLGIWTADDNSWFIGATDDAHTNAVTDVGSIFGLTKASNGFWYVDTTITVAASGACAEIMKLVDPAGTVNGKVAFKITRAYQQLFT